MNVFRFIRWGIVWALLVAEPVFLSAQTPLPQATVKTQTGANDPTAHAYIEKTRKWLRSCKSIEVRFMACMADENTVVDPTQCQRGSMLLCGSKYKLILGSEEFYSNGTDLWAYSPQNREVSIYTYNEANQELNPITLILDYEKYYRAKYIRQQTMEGSARNIIDLTPIQRSEILKIRIYLNNGDHKLFKIEMYLPRNRVYVYNIYSYRENPEVSDADFVFDPQKHPGVGINDMR